MLHSTRSAPRPAVGQLAHDRRNADNARPPMLSKPLRSPLVAAALVAGAAALAGAGCGGERAARRRRAARSCSRRSAAPATSCRTRAPRASRARTWTSPSSSRSRTASGAARSRAWSRTRSTCRRAARCPPTSYEGEDADDVAAYVASAIGKPAEGGARRARPARPRRTRRTSSRSRPTRAASSPTRSRAPTAKAGKVTLQSKNDASVPHNIAIKGDGEGPVVQGGKVSEVSGEPEGREATSSTAPCRATSRPA